jgi:hypothetical protein
MSRHNETRDGRDVFTIHSNLCKGAINRAGSLAHRGDRHVMCIRESPIRESTACERVIFVHDCDEAIGEKNLRSCVTVFFHVDTNPEVNFPIAELGDVIGIVPKKVNVYSRCGHLHPLHER